MTVAIGRKRGYEILRLFEPDKPPQGRNAERIEPEGDLQRISFRRLREIWAIEIEITPNRVQQIADQSKVLHLLPRNKHEHRRPSLCHLQDNQIPIGIEIRPRLAHRKCRKEILAAEPVLELGRRAKCLNQFFTRTDLRISFQLAFSIGIVFQLVPNINH